MKSRLIWIALVVAVAIGFYVVTIRPALQGPSERINRHKLDREFRANFKPPPIPPPPLPEVVIATPVLSPPPPRPLPIVAPRNDPVPGPQTVPIQDGVTIDFTTGTPVVKGFGKDQEALDKALKEIAEATKDVQFTPPKKD